VCERECVRARVYLKVTVIALCSSLQQCPEQWVAVCSCRSIMMNPTIQRFELNTVHLYQHYALVLTVPECGLASTLLSITSKIIPSEEIPTQHSNKWRREQSGNSLLYRCCHGTTQAPWITAARKPVSWLFPFQSSAPWIPKQGIRKRVAVKARMAHIKNTSTVCKNNVDLHDVNVRLQLLEKVWEEHNAVQD